MASLAINIDLAHFLETKVFNKDFQSIKTVSDELLNKHITYSTAELQEALRKLIKNGALELVVYDPFGDPLNRVIGFRTPTDDSVGT